MQIRNTPPGFRKRDPGMLVIWRSVSKHNRTAIRLLFDPVKEEYTEKKRTFKKPEKPKQEVIQESKEEKEN